MPTVPEVSEALGQIGAAEVLHGGEAQHEAGAQSEVGVSGEVEVDLKGEGEGCHGQG